MNQTSPPEAPLIVEQKGALRLLRMNRPTALNALNLELIEALTEALRAALADEQVQTVWLESTSERAFCAGGDVKALVGALNGRSAAEQRQAGHRYFLAEYRLDALIANAGKPIVAWGQGLVMGGGWGLFAGADVRLVTEHSRFAMPELQIGLFPDVGAAYFLQQPDWRVGTFLGISGVHLSGRDTVALGYADAMVSPEDADRLKHWLVEGRALGEWTLPDPDKEAQSIRAAWQDAMDQLPEPNLSDWMAAIEQQDFEPFKAARLQWQSGSALSMALTWHHFKKLRHASRVEVLEKDLIVGSHACSEQEFMEGVRALLIDKDKSPQWLYPSVASVPFTMIERFYRPLSFETGAIWP